VSYKEINVKKYFFGRTKDGKEVYRFEITNANGMKIGIIN